VNFEEGKIGRYQQQAQSRRAVVSGRRPPKSLIETVIGSLFQRSLLLVPIRG
jgi:hypothetical protein